MTDTITDRSTRAGTPITEYIDTATAVALVTEAVEEARRGVAGGGMPFGALLLIDGQIVTRAHNRQVQDQHYLAHAETVCLGSYMGERPDPLPPTAVLVATEAPCPMCAGTAIIAGIRTVIIGETVHYRGAVDWLADHVDVRVLNDQRCVDLVTDFRHEHPDRWDRFSAG